MFICRLFGFLTLLALLVSVSANAAPVARVEFVSGNVSIVAADATSRPATKGSEVVNGDTLKTETGMAQIKFTDGGFISLRPNSQFRVDSYTYEGRNDGNEQSIFSLVKGTLRAITGLVGKYNHKNYKMDTAVATIGIRGTQFVASYTDVLTVNVEKGLVSLTNDMGEIVLSAGQIGQVTGVQTPPQKTAEDANLPATSPPSEFDIIRGDERNPEGEQIFEEDHQEQIDPCSVSC